MLGFFFFMLSVFSQVVLKKKKRFSVKYTYFDFLLANPPWFGCL